MMTDKERHTDDNTLYIVQITSQNLHITDNTSATSSWGYTHLNAPRNITSGTTAIVSFLSGIITKAKEGRELFVKYFFLNSGNE